MQLHLKLVELLVSQDIQSAYTCPANFPAVETAVTSIHTEQIRIILLSSIRRTIRVIKT